MRTLQDLTRTTARVHATETRVEMHFEQRDNVGRQSSTSERSWVWRLVGSLRPKYMVQYSAMIFLHVYKLSSRLEKRELQVFECGLFTSDDLLAGEQQCNAKHTSFVDGMRLRLLKKLSP